MALYEWDVEDVDADGDIVDHDFHESYASARRAANGSKRVVLVRDAADGPYADRTWAYVGADGSCKGFEDSRGVIVMALPKKYQAEIARAHRG